MTRRLLPLLAASVLLLHTFAARAAEVPDELLALVKPPAHRGPWGRTTRRLLEALAERTRVHRQVLPLSRSTSAPASAPASTPAGSADRQATVASHAPAAVLFVDPTASGVLLELWLPGGSGPCSELELSTRATPTEIERTAAALLDPEPPAARTVPSARQARLLLGPTFAFGGGDGDRIFLAPGLEASLRLAGSLRGVIAASYLTVPERKVGLHYLGLPIRAGIAWRATSRPFTARLTGLIQPVWVRGGPETVSTTLFGVGAAVLYNHQLTDWLEGVLGVGGDVYFARQEFKLEGLVVLRSEQAAVWATVGLRVMLL